MWIYLFFLIVSGILGFRTDKKAGAFFYLLVLFFTVFRGETVGIDTKNYVHGGYNEWASGMRTHEIIYEWLSSFVPPSGSNLLLVVFGCLTFSGIYIASKKFDASPARSLFFFILFLYYNLSLNIARQYAAIGILLIACTFLLEHGKQKYLFFLLVLFASGIHSSSILFAIAYGCRYMDFSKVNKHILLVVLILLFIVFNYVLKDYYLQLTHFIVLTGDIEVYSKYFEQTEDYGLSLGGAIIAFGSLFINICVFARLSDDSSEKGKLIASLFFISILFDIFFINLYGNLGRIRYCFNIINIIAFARYFLFYETNKSKRCILLILTVLFYGYALVYSMLGEEKAYGTVPYVMCF